MTINAQKLFEQALTLAPADVEFAWAAEIERRAAEARQNPDDDEDWRTVLDEIQRDVLSR